MSAKEGKLAGKVVIITGASTGCGPVYAKRFVQEGGKVLLAARRLELVEEAAKEAGGGTIAMKADVTIEEDVAAMVDRCIEEFGQVDVLLNNAAVPGTDKFVWEQTLENWNYTIGVVLTGSMLCAREVIKKSMLERKTGSIINFSSTAGWTGIPRKTHYCSAKAALRAFTKTVALEVGEHGIRVNCLVPGGIQTDLMRNYGKRMAAEQGITFDEWWAAAMKSVPLRDMSTPEDITNLALFLASDDSRTITGQSINCDAGAYMVG